MSLNTKLVIILIVATITGLYISWTYTFIGLPYEFCLYESEVYESSFRFPRSRKLPCYIYEILLLLYNIIILILLLVNIYSLIRTNSSKKQPDEIPSNSLDNVMIYIKCSNNIEDIFKTISNVSSPDTKTNKIIYLACGSEIICKPEFLIQEDLAIDKTEDFTYYKGKFNEIPIFIIKYSDVQVNKEIMFTSACRFAYRIHEIFTESESEFESTPRILPISHIMRLECGATLKENSIDSMVSLVKEDVMGVIGEIRVSPVPDNLLTNFQIFDYLLLHVSTKSVESSIGQVLNLSKSFCVIRLQELLKRGVLEDFLNHSTMPFIKALQREEFLTYTLLKRCPDKKLRYTTYAQCYLNPHTSPKKFILQENRWTRVLLLCHWLYYLWTLDFNLMKKLSIFCVILYQIFLSVMFPLIISIGITNIIHNSLNRNYIIVGIEGTICLCITIAGFILFKKIKTMIYVLMYIILQPFFTLSIPYTVYKFLKNIS